jgi:hypothetical protein
MEAARTIRSAVAEVALLKQAVEANPALGDALREVKQVQSRRFAGTYSDLLAGGPHAAAAEFFLVELYSDKDYAERDMQFARTAGAMEQLFPEQVTATAVALAQLHALTEELDQAMALAWLAQVDESLTVAQRYSLAWREVERRADRERQLRAVLGIGVEITQLTRAAGLRLMVKTMRAPAAVAGLGALQRFLECGFDTFRAMAKRPGRAEDFLATIKLRETALMQLLFDADLVACETELARILGQAP